MYIRPSIQDMLETVIISLTRDIAPELDSSRAKTCLSMAQSVLRCVIQRSAREHAQLCQEHNEMSALLRNIASALQENPSHAAERIRKRSLAWDGKSNIPIPYPIDTLRNDYRQLSEALTKTLDDLDELIRSGEDQASAALDRLRRYLFSRTIREVETMQVTPGSLAGSE